MTFLEELAARRRFGMKPGLDTIRALCSALGDPQRRMGRVIHVAGTNGKGAVCAVIDAALRTAPGCRVGRYTSPHLVKLNERFFLDGAPIDDAVLEKASSEVSSALYPDRDLTFFEALTAVAFQVYAGAGTDYVVLETGLGGRLDATNVCEPALSVITRIGLDHCDWLGDTVEKIAAEKAGIVKPGVPVVLGRNCGAVRAVIEARAKELGSPFRYAPELVDDSEIPADFPLRGTFNRENAVTALAALKTLGEIVHRDSSYFGFGSSLSVSWPGRFQLIGDVLVDGAHNPPAARALVEALQELFADSSRVTLVFGACGDKDVREVLSILKPFVDRGIAVKTNNPRSLPAVETAALMREVGIPAVPAESLSQALALARTPHSSPVLVCGSLFLAGEAIVELGAYPWGRARFDAAESLKRVPR